MNNLATRHATYVRNFGRRKTPLNVDLNVPPPSDNRENEQTTTHTRSQVSPSVQQGGIIPPPTIDLEEFDDDVLISTPGAFAEAKNNSRRTRRRAVLVDVDSEIPSMVAPHDRSKRGRGSASQTSMDGDLYIILEGSSNAAKEVEPGVTMPAPPPMPKEPVFTCPVCMGPLVEEMSTKCGHIFCTKCLRAAIASQHKCPTCRRKVSMKDSIRVYLPATN